MLAPKAVIFDFDGVVVDSEPLIYEAATRIFATFGARITLEDVRPGIGAGSSYVSIPMKKYGITGVTVEEMVRRRAEEYLKIARTRLRKKEGFDSLMKGIRSRGWKTALASSSTNDWIEKSMEYASVDSTLFDVIVNGDSIPRKKPFPDLFLKAVEGLGVPPNGCVVVEDAAPGVEAAHRAGIPCVALVGTMSRNALREADFLAESLDEVAQVLLTIPQA